MGPRWGWVLLSEQHVRLRLGRSRCQVRGRHGKPRERQRHRPGWSRSVQKHRSNYRCRRSLGSRFTAGTPAEVSFGDVTVVAELASFMIRRLMSRPKRHRRHRNRADRRRNRPGTRGPATFGRRRSLSTGLVHEFGELGHE